MDFNIIFGRGFGFICVFSRTNFSGTSLRFDLAASTSCNKYQGLHLQCGYRLVRWDTNWCFQFANRVWDFFVTNFVIAYSVVIVLSLFIICLCYLSIRKKLYSPNPAFDKTDSRKRLEQNIKLSKTTFFLIGASIAFWALSTTLYIIKTFVPNLFPRLVTFILFMLHATNSLVNPMIYSFRMVVFKKT